MKKFFSMALLAGITMLSIQSNTTYAQDAKQILQKVSAKYKTAPGIKGAFTLNFKDAKGNVKTTQNGTIALKGNKYKVNIAGQDIITDGKSTWTYRKADNEVQIDKYNAGVAMSPAKLFAGSYEKDYNYKYISETTINGKKAHVVELTPKVAQRDFSNVQLFVDKANHTVVGGKVLEKTGSTIEYTLSNVNNNANLPDSEFYFDTKKHPKVDVIDLR